MSLNNLFAFGCSETYGQFLPDTDENGWKSGGSLYAWPALIANRLSMKCINLARPGTSNKRIFLDIFDNLSKVDKVNDIIVVQWTFITRHSVYISEDNIIDINSFPDKGINDNTPKGRIKDSYEKYLCSHDYYYDRHLDNFIYIDYINKILKNYNIYNFSVLETDFSNMFNFMDFEILATNEKFSCMPPKARDGVHTGVNGHIAQSEHYFNKIIEKK